MAWRRSLQSPLTAVGIALASMLAPLHAASRRAIDPARSTMTVHVVKSGLFRAFADNHEIRGTVTDGFIDEDEAAVELVVEAPQLRVLDPNLSPKDRADVQARMLGAEVLDASRFPQIRFVSRTAERTASGWVVHGDLTLHDQTRPVTVTVTRAQDHYIGSAHLKQTDFGMTPITVAGGAVRVKDELTVDFDIVTRPVSGSSR